MHARTQTTRSNRLEETDAEEEEIEQRTSGEPSSGEQCRLADGRSKQLVS